MRNSWLALAMKSARMRSTRRASVRSRSVTSVAIDVAVLGGERRDADLEQPLDRHALAPQRGLRLAGRARRGGWRRARRASAARAPADRRAAAPATARGPGALAAIARPSASTSSAGSGMAPTSLPANGERTCAASSRRLGIPCATHAVILQTSSRETPRRLVPAVQIRGFASPRAATASAAPPRWRPAARAPAGTARDNR